MCIKIIIRSCFNTTQHATLRCTVCSMKKLYNYIPQYSALKFVFNFQCDE